VSMFDRPAPPGDQFQAETHVGALLAIEVLEHVPPMQTKVSDKPQDSIRANVYVIAPNGTVAEEFQNTLLWGRILVSRLRQSVGRTVLGVLTGQPGVKRDGRNIPYDLDDPTEAMEQAAVRAMTSRPQPAQQQQQQAPSDPWAAQQAPPGWGAPAPQQPAPWGQQPPVQQPQPAAAGWGAPPAPPAQQGPPPGWGQQPPAPPQQPAASPWGAAPAPDQGWGQQQAPAQQQLPEPPAADLPPWEQPGYGQQ
jgi:hypothetical protein